MTTHSNAVRRLLLLAAILWGLASCSIYTGVGVGVPFPAAGVYVNPGIGFGVGI